MEIVIEATISPDRRLIDYELPSDAPVGRVRLVIQLNPAVAQTQPALTREAARARLLAGGALNIHHHAPAGTVPLSDDELAELGHLERGARSSEEIMDEDRGHLD